MLALVWFSLLAALGLVYSIRKGLERINKVDTAIRYQRGASQRSGGINRPGVN